MERLLWYVKSTRSIVLWFLRNSIFNYFDKMTFIQRGRCFCVRESSAAKQLLFIKWILQKNGSKCCIVNCEANETWSTLIPCSWFQRSCMIKAVHSFIHSSIRSSVRLSVHSFFSSFAYLFGVCVCVCVYISRFVLCMEMVWKVFECRPSISMSALSMRSFPYTISNTWDLSNIG